MGTGPQHRPAFNDKNPNMKLFASLRTMREFERGQLPFIASLLDFDLIIEIGYAQEEDKPLTPKQLFLLEIGSVTTVRRRLARLTEQGVVRRRINPADRRSEILTVTAPNLKLLGKYGRVLTAFAALT